MRQITLSSLSCQYSNNSQETIRKGISLYQSLSLLSIVLALSANSQELFHVKHLIYILPIKAGRAGQHKHLLPARERGQQKALLFPVELLLLLIGRELGGYLLFYSGTHDVACSFGGLGARCEYETLVILKCA